MNPNDHSTNNTQDSEQMPKLVDWDTEVEDAIDQDAQQVPSAKVPSGATVPASGGGSEDSTVHAVLEISDHTAFLVQWLVENMEQLRDLLLGTHRIRALSAKTDNCPEQFRRK